jgi:hypothetical protein
MSDPKGESSGRILHKKQTPFGLILLTEIMAFLKLSVCVVGEGICCLQTNQSQTAIPSSHHLHRPLFIATQVMSFLSMTTTRMMKEKTPWR